MKRGKFAIQHYVKRLSYYHYKFVFGSCFTYKLFLFRRTQTAVDEISYEKLASNNSSAIDK